MPVKRKPAAKNTEHNGNKPRGNPNWRKGGPSPNPGGRPKQRASIAYWLNEFANMTGAEAAAACAAYAADFKKAKGPLPLAGVIAARALLELMQEPSSSLFGQVLDRIDGKVTQPIEWREALIQQGYDPATIFERMVAAAAAELGGTGNSGSDS